jgi:hypothetical protein
LPFLYTGRRMVVIAQDVRNGYNDVSS